MTRIVSDGGKYRDQRDAERYRLLQAEAFIKLFTMAKGRGPTNMDEMVEWASTADHPRPIDPFAVLTEEEVAQAVARADEETRTFTVIDSRPRRDPE